LKERKKVLRGLNIISGEERQASKSSRAILLGVKYLSAAALEKTLRTLRRGGQPLKSRSSFPEKGKR